MLIYVGRRQGWSLTGIPARDLQDDELESLAMSTDELIASGCYVYDTAVDPLGDFNAARELVVAAKKYQDGIEEIVVDTQDDPVNIRAAFEPRDEHPLAEDVERLLEERRASTTVSTRRSRADTAEAAPSVAVEVPADANVALTNDVSVDRAIEGQEG
jgi:hypothetical protein